jgi:peptidyl-prolyl cis-trans isomerase C
MTVLKRSLVPLLLSVALLGAACSNGDELDVMATVNGVDITADELVATYVAGGNAPSGADGLADMDRTGGLTLGAPGVAQALGTLIQLEAGREAASALGIETPSLTTPEAIQTSLGLYLSSLTAVVPDAAEVASTAEGLLATVPCSSHILVATEAEALDVIARLDAGEAFADVASEVSTDTGSAAVGGDLQCQNIQGFDPGFATGLLGLEVGDRSGVVASSFGFHIIERYEAPPELVAQAEQVAREQLTQGWLNDRALEADVYVDPAVGVWNGTNIIPADPASNG